MNRITHTSAALLLAAGLGLGLAACEDNSNDRDNTPSDVNDNSMNDTAPTTPGVRTPRDTTGAEDRNNNMDRRDNMPAGGNSNMDNAPAPDRPANSDAGAAASPDARILSILHAKNQEEIAIGKLAQEKGASTEVKQYGQMLVADHSASDEQVRAAAEAAGVTLTPPPVSSTDPTAELRGLSGEAFDRALAEKMRVGHAELIKTVEEAQSRVRDEDVRQLLTDTLETLRKHEEHAQNLPA